MKTLLASLALVISALSAHGESVVSWTFPTEQIPTGATLYPNAQQPTGAAIAAGAQAILLRGDGTPAWKTALPRAAASTPCVADLEGDGTTEVLLILQQGGVACLEGADGALRWVKEFNGNASTYTLMAAGDVLEAPGLEVVFGFEDGWLRCLDAKGNELARFFGDKFRVGSPVIADVNRDGANEVVYATDNGNIYCLSGMTSVLWRHSEEQAPYGRSGPNVADIDGDGAPEVLITRSGTGLNRCLMALDGGTGAVKWRTKNVQQSYVSNAPVDLDGDGKLETLHACKGNWLYCTNADGSERWRTELWGRGIFFAPVVADVNGDKALEILAAVRDTDPGVGACAYLLDAKGAVLENIKVAGNANVGPTVADINGDGKLEALLCTGSPNAVQALTWNAGGAVAWPSLRGGSDMNAATAKALGKAPAPKRLEKPEAAPALFGENSMPLSWEKPVQENAFLLVGVNSATGSETRVYPLAAGATKAVAPYVLIPAAAGDASLVGRFEVWDGQENRLSKQCAFQIAPPDACDIDAASAACGEAITAAKAAKADSRMLAQNLALLQIARQQVQGDSPAETAARATELRKQAENLRQLATILGDYWKQQGAGSFFCWQDANPWDAFDAKALPESIAAAPAITVEAFGNEQEDVAINLRNITTEALDVRCMFAKPDMAGAGKPPAEPPLAGHVTLRRGLLVPGHTSPQVMDALPELDTSRTITLSPGQASQLWLVVNTEGLAPGAHSLTLYLGALQRPATVVAVPVTINVAPIALPKGVYAQMNWVGIDLKECSDQQLKDMLDHGITVAYGPKLPVIPLDGQGEVAGPVDWSSVDAALKRVPGYFQCLWPSAPAPQWPQGVTAAEGTPLFEKGYAACLNEMVQHLRAVGWGYERWALYPYDEPWLTGFTLVGPLKKFCERVKRIDPLVRNYADPAGRVLPEFLEGFKDLLDVYQPEMNLLRRDPALLEWCQKNAGTFWAYEATDPGKELLPLGYYRAYGWSAWYFGLQGAGFWCYKYFDMYWPLETTDWSVVYQTNDQVVPSRRWEAVRDGQEDYRLFYAWREEIRRARRLGHTAEADQAQKTLDQIVNRVIGAQVHAIDEITRQTRDYEVPLTAFQDARREITQEIAALRALNP